MSLGFDAFGRLAFGQISTGQSLAFTLIADSGSYTVTGQVAVFFGRGYAATGAYVFTWAGAYGVARLACQTGAYALTGNGVAFGGKFAAQSGSYSISGGEAATATRFKAVSGSYAFSGSAAFLTTLSAAAGSYSIAWGGPVAPIRLAADPGQYVVTWGEFDLRRSGYDYEPGYAGIGHYLEEQVRLRRLAKIVRKTPRPVISAVPVLPHIASIPPVPRVDAGLLNGVQALQDNQPDMAAVRKQAQRRAALALLLAA